jgi:hypothetical protein
MALLDVPQKSPPYLTIICILAAINAATAMMAIGACIFYVRRRLNVWSDSVEGRNPRRERERRSSKLPLQEITRPEPLTPEEFRKLNLRQLPMLLQKSRRKDGDYRLFRDVIHHQHTVGASNSNLVPRPLHIISKNKT